MPDSPMKFCASMTKCSKAYTVGAPGTVKIAHDSAPIDESKINGILTFLSSKLSEGDFATVTDMLDDVIDKAEDLNPTKRMAADALPAATRRIVRRAVRGPLLGYDARPAGMGMAVDAQREAEVKAVLPNHDRLKLGGSFGYAAPIPPKPSRPLTTATRAEVEREFPNMFKGS
ncbi:hypothetical protein ABID82_004005 [Methylobacterium sp. PvP062]|uniref:Uncharacterized protein n=1 Tax=Methylobacterium radiotolerans TaxID=31998 RepID=A0ABV2NG42_9HYPH|nr:MULTISPECIES: hypothetical protein [unclassified Methylobacterium]MBP2497800.1 hypothetical protein [Methylobacterium sp. PvP105]MBP2502329.1 hypothetical protein [Methylobacterium sp. PvP109]MCX7335109.1 hypothetical protein [Hyphomicrobiales bacterium]